MRPVVIAIAAAVVLTGCGADRASRQPPSAAELAGTASWSELPDSPLSARYDPVTAWDGHRFFVLGGNEGIPCPPNADCALPDDPQSDGAVFDPQTSEWTMIASAPLPVTGQTVVVGDFLYVLTYEMGRDGTVAFMSYDIADDRWRLLPSPPTRLPWLTGSDDVVMTFDEQSGRNHFFDPETKHWRPLPASPFGPRRGGYPVWTGEEILLTAHKVVPNDHAPVVELAALDPDAMTWADRGETDIVGYGPMRVSDLVVWPSAEQLDGGEVDNWGRMYDEGAIYDPASKTWKPLPPLPDNTGGLCCALTTGTWVAIAGNLLDPRSDTWVEVPTPPGGVRYGAASTGGGDHVLLWGGTTFDEPGASLDTGYLLTIEE